MLPSAGVCLQLAIVATALKLLLVPTYRSTDFEVHRNWLAITHSLPLNKWYVEQTSEWTLDYPPFFAWFEWLLSQFARLVDPAMLVVNNLNYASSGTVLFQRGSVIVTDAALLSAAFALARLVAGDAPGGSGRVPGPATASTGRPLANRRGELLFFLLACNAGLLLLDHVHFQYNGVMMGILLWSVHAAMAGRHLLSGLLFAALLNLKHLFLYAAPAYFVYLLRHHCLAQAPPAGLRAQPASSCGTPPAAAASAAALTAEGAAGRAADTAANTGCEGGAAATAAAAAVGRLGAAGARSGATRAGSGSTTTSSSRGELLRRAAVRLAVLGGGVAALFLASFGPFAAMGQIPQVLRRLFPFGRGLLHAYWAANAWAPYAAADKLLALALPTLGPRLGLDLERLGIRPEGSPANMAGGLVGVSSFTVLPQVTPAATAAAVLLALTPCLVALWTARGVRQQDTGGGGGSGGCGEIGSDGYIRRVFSRAVSYSFLCGFVFGYHVHEKAVLVALLPLAIDAVRCPTAARRFLLLSSAGHYGLLPLLFRPQEYGAKVLLVLSYFVIAAAGLCVLHDGRSVTQAADGSGGARLRKEYGARNPPGGRAAAVPAGGTDVHGSVGVGSAGQGRRSTTATRVLGPLAWAYLAGFLVVEAYVSLVHAAVPALRERLPFAPLMLTSVYCSLGVLAVWADMAVEWVCEAAR